jgi:hypothetical protein
LGGVVLGAATAAAGAVAAIGVAAFNVSRETENAAASIAASLNIPREEAEKFAEVARQVYGNNFADSITEAGAAVGAVLHFQAVTVDAAEALARAHEAQLQQLLAAIEPLTLVDGVDLAALYAHNLVSAMVDALDPADPAQA